MRGSKKNQSRLRTTSQNCTGCMYTACTPYFVVLDFLWHLPRWASPGQQETVAWHGISNSLTAQRNLGYSIYLLPDATPVPLASWTVCPSFHHRRRRMMIFNTTAYVFSRCFSPSEVVGNVLDAKSWKMFAQPLARRYAEEASTDLVLPPLDYCST